MQVPLCIGLILATAAASCLCRPAGEAPGTPHQLPPSLVRRDWPQSLSQEQKHLISQFLPHVFTELGDHKGYGEEGTEALHDHYYPDWMDFGRRSAERSDGAA
ncbi:ANTR protein, partial [Alcedo cyanopectus]|nr:ANTR protein [Ceyx cyanopectus]